MVDKKKELQEYQEVQYVRELTEYWNAFMYALINEIYVGIAINLGMSEKEAYKLSENNPNELRKGFFDNIYDRFKGIFGYKIPKFRVKKSIYNKGKPLNQPQWKRINQQISDFWNAHSHKPAENVTVKAFMLGKKTAAFRKQGLNYKFKGLEQTGKKLPSTLVDALKSYDFRNSEKKAMAEALSRVAMHVTESGNGIEESIRKNIVKGLADGKSGPKIASDLFWEVQVKGAKKGDGTAAQIRRNWNRIAVTETQSIYEAGILAPHEEEASESIKGNGVPQYFIFVGGSCHWCRDHQGTVVRLVPGSFVKDKGNDSLSAMGIKDKITDIAVWIGKNNVGKYSYKNPEWMICTPAHPHNVATLEPFDPETQEYNEKTNRIEPKQQYKTKYITTRKPFEFTADEIKERKAHYVGTDKVSYNDHIYEAVRPEDYKKKTEAWKKDPKQPIPVDITSTSYRKIFGDADKNK